MMPSKTSLFDWCPAPGMASDAGHVRGARGLRRLPPASGMGNQAPEVVPE
jgi:hypothetical protein